MREKRGLTAVYIPKAYSATLTVAAQDATAASRARADYVCDGVADEVQIGAALAALPAGVGGSVLLTEGTFNLASTVSLPYYDTGDGSVAFYALRGHGSKLVYTGTGSMIKRYPGVVGDINKVWISYVLEGFTFKGPQDRTSIAIDLASHTNTRIVNCSFTNFGIGVRMVYGFWPTIQLCNFNHQLRAGVWFATGYGLLPGGGTPGVHMGAGHVVDGCHFLSYEAVDLPIEGMSRANPCVVSWIGHGMETGDLIFLSGVTQADWDALSKTRQTVTRIDADSFSIPVNTSGYGAAYVPGTDPGVYAKHTACLISGSGQMDVRQCGFEGNSGIDNIYLYQDEFDGSVVTLTSAHQFRRLYHENVPIAKGALICLDKNYAGYLTVDNVNHSTTGITVIDAYDAASCVLDLNNFHIVQNAYMRATRTTKAVNAMWNIRGFGIQSENVDWADSAHWVGGVLPTDGFGTLAVERFSSTGKVFSCLKRSTRFEGKIVHKGVVFSANDATPDIRFGNYFKTANTAGTTITDFDNGEDGQTIQVIIDDADTTVDFTGTNLLGNGGVDWNPAVGDWLEALFDGSEWHCAVHSVS